MRNAYIFVFVFILTVSCNNPEKENTKNIVFFEDYPGSRLWVDKNEINIEEMKNVEGRRSYIRCSYDPITYKIWVWNIDNEFNNFYLVDVTNGKYLSDEEIRFEIPNEMSPVFVFSFNNYALVEYRWGFYGLIDLRETFQTFLDLREALKDYNTSGTIGYDLDNIFFVNGFFNIAKSDYYNYEISIKSPRIMTIEHKIIGLDDNNDIFIYDYYNGSVEATNINFNDKFNMLKYEPSDLYFLSGEKLFFSYTVSNLTNIFARFRKPAYRTWYVYDLLLGTTEKCSSPSGYAKILGISP
jgi:hypothetical protein